MVLNRWHERGVGAGSAPQIQPDPRLVARSRSGAKGQNISLAPQNCALNELFYDSVAICLATASAAS